MVLFPRRAALVRRRFTAQGERPILLSALPSAYALTIPKDSLVGTTYQTNDYVPEQTSQQPRDAYATFSTEDYAVHCDLALAEVDASTLRQ